jgi:hypothetical protein
MIHEKIPFYVHKKKLYLKRIRPRASRLTKSQFYDFCDLIDDAYSPVSRQVKIESLMFTLTGILCFLGWGACAFLYLWDGVDVPILFVVIPVSIVLCILLVIVVFTFTRKVKKEVRLWPERIKQICFETSTWIPGTAIRFRYCINKYYKSYIEFIMDEEEYSDHDDDDDSENDNVDDYSGSTNSGCFRKLVCWRSNNDYDSDDEDSDDDEMHFEDDAEHSYDQSNRKKGFFSFLRK